MERVSYEDPLPESEVTRNVGYAATLKTAPAYTFGLKRSDRNDDPGPGPGEYQPDKFAWLHSKGAKFGSSSRYKSPPDQSPSPQDFKVKDMDLKASAAFTFGSKHKSGETDKTPAPTAYNAGEGKEQIKHKSPAFSMGARQEPISADGTPAPNTYDTRSKTFSDRPGVSIKFRSGSSRSSMTADPGPGPGHYPLHEHYKSPYAKTFGVGRSSSNLDNGVPGPIYNLDAGYEATKPHRTSWSLSRSPRNNQACDTGPLSTAPTTIVDRPCGYSVSSDRPSAPSYTIPGRYYFSAADATPSPLDYKPKDDYMRKSAPAFSLHGSTQKDSRRNYPGPGAYVPEKAISAPSTHLSPSAITIASRFEPPANRERRPGPGSYNATDFKVKTSPGVSIKFRHDRSSAEPTPAPHDYADKDFQVNLTKKSKGISFGIRHKEETRELVPGPNYAIGCSTLGVAACKRIPKTKAALTLVL